jgi:hypothetical protein
VAAILVDADRRRTRGRAARGARLHRVRPGENGTVYHTYTVTAPDPFVAPFFSSCSIARRSRNPASRATTERTNIRTEGQREDKLMFDQATEE